MLSFIEIGWFSIVTMLVAVAVSSLCDYFENKLPAFLCAGYVVLCLFVPGFVVFLPLIVYDCAGRVPYRAMRGEIPRSPQKGLARFTWILALPTCFLIGIPQVTMIVMLSSGVAFLLQYRTAAQLKSRDEYFNMMDSAKERAELLEQKNRDLMEKQDYEVKLATLAERNRIAREIHDNVGHLLTRSLLQIDALRVIYSDNSKLTDEFNLIKDTLSDAMNSIRSSVHDLHDESVDLKSQLETLVNGFNFCPVRLRYNAGTLPVEVRLCFSSIVRESLSNIARHSNATEAAVTVTEHPAFYQLLILDNGTVKASISVNGIGLQNMTDRVDTLGGIFHTERNKGFKIFISIPKS